MPSSEVSSFYEVVHDSSTYARARTTSGSVSGSAWGTSASVSGSIAAQASRSSRTVTTLDNFHWLSEPFTALDVSEPGRSSRGNDVTLTPDARQYLLDVGPVAFHSKYGTHYVIGDRYGMLLVATAIS